MQWSIVKADPQVHRLYQPKLGTLLGDIIIQTCMIKYDVQTDY